MNINQLFNLYFSNKAEKLPAQCFLDCWMVDNQAVTNITKDDGKYTINNTQEIDDNYPVTQGDIFQQIENHSMLWNKTLNYRFYFTYYRFNYQMTIVFGNDKIKCGTVYSENVRHSGVVRYTSRFDKLETVFNPKILSRYTDEIVEEISVMEEIAQEIEQERIKQETGRIKKFTPEPILQQLSFNPNSCLIMPKKAYIAAVNVAKAIDITSTQRSKVIAELQEYNFWAVINGRVLGGKNHKAQEKFTAHFIYQALRSVSPLSFDAVVNEVKTLPDCAEKENYQQGIRIALETFKNCELVVIDWKDK